MTRALLDGDIYAFRNSASAENDSVDIAIARVEEAIDRTLQETGANEFSVFLSGPNNFRYKIYPEYKANRIDTYRPRHLPEVREYLIDKYAAQVSDGCEADDLLGIEQCRSSDTVICSLDKDLRMIPGEHYSFEISGTVKGKSWVKPMERVFVSNQEALYNFYYQLLVGDPADNMKGATGIGKVTAKKLLAGLTEEEDMFEAVRSVYSSDEELLMQGQCLWIWRKENDIWKFPVNDPTEQ